jgi:hypothetical protein
LSDELRAAIGDLSPQGERQSRLGFLWLPSLRGVRLPRAPRRVWAGFVGGSLRGAYGANLPAPPPLPLEMVYHPPWVAWTHWQAEERDSVERPVHVVRRSQ